MSLLNQGRNEIRFGNSDGKCLLENWVEERQVKPYDTVEGDKESNSSAQLFRDGHPGILTLNCDAAVEKDTTQRTAYRRPQYPGVRLEGKKSELMAQMFMEQTVNKVFNTELNPPEPEPTDFRSVTTKDFNVEGFKHEPPAPTKAHNYRKEQPVTFWSEHKDKIHGVSSEKTRDTPFRKNDAFSQPIDEYFNDTQPYDQENYPKM